MNNGSEVEKGIEIPYRRFDTAQPMQNTDPPLQKMLLHDCISPLEAAAR